jgi:hypothetical protein
MPRAKQEETHIRGARKMGDEYVVKVRSPDEWQQEQFLSPGIKLLIRKEIYSLPDMIHEFFRRIKHMTQHLVNVFLFARVMARIIERMEMLLEELSAFKPGFTVGHEREKPVPAGTRRS